MTIIEVTGEVDQKERSQIMRSGIIKPNNNAFTNVPIFRLRLITSTGCLVQIQYKGEPPGDADIGEQVEVKGVDRGGIIHARSIFNISTGSWVTSPPGFLEKIFHSFF